MREQGIMFGLALIFCACGGEVSSERVVHPGESIQAAIDAAPPNSTIAVEPGVYRESAGGSIAITVAKNGVHLVGRSTAARPVVLGNPDLPTCASQ